ncbi:type II restriction endonuclease [Dehalogenimonas alkenigignens]|uniref:type II restriction endonuclease n=1 Tax=Dehalogenimonas alkenigignens TaxID=1217799 RepID=UPI000D5828F0|nr:type II restriction endonuclease [Dehalogenimonas alkenigignens]PVV83506.1 type II restriction endonuclease [Dehalogenimonas alkenigignens]
MQVDVSDWITEVGEVDSVWFLKRLSANDTLANGSHQAGLYVPKEFLFGILPALNQPKEENPDVWFELYIDSHADYRKVRAIWYNNRLRGKTRNEARITQFGGSSSPLLDPDSTGSLVIFAFVLNQRREAEYCRVWVCRNETEADVVEEKTGPVEPGEWISWSPEAADQVIASTKRRELAAPGSCWLKPEEIPAAWLKRFPSGAEIINKAMILRPEHGASIDKRLMKRRDCEYEIFRSVEEAIEQPNITHGFSNVDEFIARAQTILQRRKARAGRSLELHTRAIFTEEGLREDMDFTYCGESEPNKTPDFLFPSETAYKNSAYPSEKLRMLAVKTTCKDRWRQILNEADRINSKHLLTLQEGVSENQFKEMAEKSVTLVVPEPLFLKYPKSIQPHLKTLESFIGDIRILLSQAPMR